MKIDSNKFNFDIVHLESEIKKLANDYLDEITEENIKMFSESIKMIGESTLENYYLKIDEHYSEGLFKIKDEETLSKFTDFANGYRYSMKVWARENEIKLEQVEIPNIEIPQKPNYNKNLPKIIFGAGTLVAVGVAIISNVWVGIIAELLVLGLTYKTIKNQQQKDTDYEFDLRKYQTQIESEKAKLITGLTEDIKKWLENAEKKSNQLLKSFNI